MRRLQVPNFVKCMYSVLRDMIDHDAFEYAGYLSFLLILSIFPSIFILTALLGTVADDIAQYKLIQNFISQSFNNLPEGVISGLKPIVNEIISGPPNKFLTIAVFAAIWTSSSALEGLRTVLNKAYRVHKAPHYVLRRILSMLQVFFILSVLALIVFSFIVIPLILHSDHFDIDDYFFSTIHFKYISYTITLLLLFCMISWIYIMVPNIKQKVIHVIPGSIATLILWVCASYSMSIYFRFSPQLYTIYGSLAGIIASLIFFYVMSVCLIFGAELNYHLHCDSISYINQLRVKQYGGSVNAKNSRNRKARRY